MTVAPNEGTLARPQDWEERSACLNLPNWQKELFFLHGKEAEREAKAICATCEVQEECLSFAIEYRINHGVFGGLNEEERKKIIRRQYRQNETRRRPPQEKISA